MSARTPPATDGNVPSLAAVLAAVEGLNARIDALFEKTRVNDDTILTIPELAEQEGCSRRTILRWVKRGMPTRCRAKGRVRIRYGDALAWLNRKQRRTT